MRCSGCGVLAVIIPPGDGKDVLHYPSSSTELVKLTPDPEMEEMLGTFPTAYKVPDRDCDGIESDPKKRV